MSEVISLKLADMPAAAQPDTLAQLMMAAHSIQKRVMDELSGNGGYRKLSLAYVDFIARLSVRDYAPGELAEALGISKQACSKVIRELEDHGLIERRANPADSRSALLSLSPAGWRLTQDGREAADAVLRQV